ncbi:hypothetical protein [Mobilicoccus massiliensis]|uniref:hypothetical protein n=1 Tax=Mobilicoccus massiliensis TaxID=1522310 RepID=UPI00059050AA|nr:hypothetical protein [Mobilicoccus massiliensis]
MRGEPAPWSAAAQTRLLGGLRAGESPARLCRDLGRDPADVRRRLGVLLGDAVDPRAGDDATTDLDLLWLRVRTGDVLPVPLSPEAVADLWQTGTGLELSDRERGELAADPLVPRLAETGRHALRTTTPEVVEASGMLDLADWLEAANDHDASAHLGAPRAALAATVDDIAPAGSRGALARHLGLDPPDAGPRAEVDRRERALGVLDAVRAASVPGRPAAVLRDLLANPESVRDLTRDLSGGFAVATTLAILGGRHESDALRLAGRIHTRWSTPPNLGRGAIVRVGL